jgi:hypothetical protein
VEQKTESDEQAEVQEEAKELGWCIDATGRMVTRPRHYTPAEMQAAAERDSKVRREGNVNLLAGMRESSVRRYVCSLRDSGTRQVQGC